MEKEVLDFVVGKTHDLMNAASCSSEAKTAAQAWLDALGTENEARKKRKNTLLSWKPILCPLTA